MVCNLVKRKNRILGSDGKNHVFTNYFLQFDNGIEIPVCPRYFSTKSTDKKEVDKWNQINSKNATRFDTLATLVDSESSDK